MQAEPLRGLDHPSLIAVCIIRCHALSSADLRSGVPDWLISSRRRSGLSAMGTLCASVTALR